MKTIRIHTDGSCHGNPGPGGFAAIIELEDEHERQEYTVSGGDPNTTNNRMELAAIIETQVPVNYLVEHQRAEITIYSDSKYVIDAFNKGWVVNWQKNGWRNANKKPVANRALWEKLVQFNSEHHITWEWVQGHSGDPMNERCDQIANEQADAAANEPEYRRNTSAPKSETQDGPKISNENLPVGSRIATEPAYDHVYHEAMATMNREEDLSHILPGLAENNSTAEQARIEGYEAAKQEMRQHLLNLESGPPPAYRDYTDGHRDCRSEVLQFLDRMQNHQDLPF